MKAHLILLLLIFSSYAPAQEVVEPIEGDFAGTDQPAPNADSESVPGLGMEAPVYAGSGCPQGTASAILSPDQRTLSILFDSYVVQAGPASRVNLVQGSCQIRIPMNVPAGYRVQVVKLDYRGFNSLPQGAMATFSAGFRYLKLRRMDRPLLRFRKGFRFQGPLVSEFSLSSIMRGPPWSPCGKAFVLAADSLLTVRASNATEEAVSSIDSLDGVQKPVRLGLRWRKCRRDTDRD